MSEYLIQEESLTAIADAIRAKAGSSAALTPEAMVTAIAAIKTGETIKTGSVTPGAIDLETSRINVTGLGGKPKQIVLMSKDGGSSNTTARYLFCVASGSYLTACAIVYKSTASGTTYYADTTTYPKYISVSLSSTGFSVSATDGAIKTFSGAYSYMAIM